MWVVFNSPLRRNFLTPHCLLLSFHGFDNYNFGEIKSTAIFGRYFHMPIHHGHKLKALRMHYGWTQAELAALLTKRVRQKVSTTAVSNWEISGLIPGVFIIPALCATFKLSADPFLGIRPHRYKTRYGADSPRQKILLRKALEAVSPARPQSSAPPP